MIRSIIYLFLIVVLVIVYAFTSDKINLGPYLNPTPPPIVSPIGKPIATPKNTPDPTPDPQKTAFISGKASYYSREGCLGCDPAFRTASGEILDDTKHTMALAPETVKQYKAMGKTLRVTNPKTNIVIAVKVNDTGGFSKYGRIADLSLASKNSLGCSDLCGVVIDFGNIVQ